MNDRHIVLKCDLLPQRPSAWLEEHARVIDCSPESPDFDRALADADGLVIRTFPNVDDELLAKAPRLRVIGRAGVGIDHIDLDACRRRHIEVVHTPDANTQSVAEYVLSILLHRWRPLAELDRPVDLPTWRALRIEEVAAREMSTLTFGVLGRGRIGTRVTEILLALGARVVYHDVLDVAACGRAEAVDLETLLSESDCLTIHVDGRRQNHHFLDAARLAQLKADIVFVNTSRGSVVDSAALTAFLRQYPAAHAYLDVHEEEPVPANDALFGLPNATLYPHLASRTRTALTAMGWVVRDVIDVLEGRPARHPAPFSE